MISDLIKNNIILIPLVTAFLTTVIVTPLSLIFIKKFGILDNPKLHKHPAIIHKKPIPRAGGIPLCLGILIPGLFLLPLTKEVTALFIAAFIALTIGVLDDKFDLSPYLRFATNIVVALIVVLSGTTIPFITNPTGGILHLNEIKLHFDLFGGFSINFLSDLIAIFWMVWVMNMLNWSKGVDGQMPGIVAISAIVIGILSLRFPLTDINTLIAAKLSFLIAGSAFGFLIYNFYPAKIFPGYGATAVYLMLSAVSILSGAKLATAILVMGVPMTDGLFTFFRRIVTGKSPFWHDKKHLHHLLLEIGLSQRQIALFYWVFSAILGLVSLMLSSKGKAFVIIMLLVLVGGALVFLHSIVKNYEDKNL